MPITFHDLVVYFILIAGIIFSINRKKLTPAAAFTAAVIGLLVYKGTSFAGLAMLVLFFLLGSFATKLFGSKKQSMGIAEQNNGRRTTSQVLANGGVAAILSAIAWYKPAYSSTLTLMMAGSLSAATADTLSSELGSIFGRKFYDVLSFEKSAPGPDGVISLEGTLIGIIGAALITLVYEIAFGFSYLMFAIIIAGIVGNLADSILGATLERKHLIGNNTVNFFNTVTGAFVCLLSSLITR